MSLNTFILFVILISCLVYSIECVNSDVIQWNVSAVTNKKENRKVILNQAVGNVNRGKLHAIIGPSGSGKVFTRNSEYV